MHQFDQLPLNVRFAPACGSAEIGFVWLLRQKLSWNCQAAQDIGRRDRQELVLANLLELYAHDFSEFHDLELGMDGRFGYSHLPLYWSELADTRFLSE